MPRPIRHYSQPDVVALMASRDLAAPAPIAGVHFGRGRHVPMPSAWDSAVGKVPVGWTGYDGAWPDDGIDDYQTTMPEQGRMNDYVTAQPPGTVSGPDVARVAQAYAANPPGTEPGPPPQAQAQARPAPQGRKKDKI